MFANPKNILQEFGISAGATVVDLGSGTGAYALAAASILVATGESGKVYAIDVQKDLLDRLKTEVMHQHLANVEVIWGNVEKLRGTKLPDGIADIAIVSNILFQIEDQPTFVSEVSRLLKQQGRVLCIEWTQIPYAAGAGHHPLTKMATQALFEKGGLLVDREINAGSNHYGLILRKK